MDIPHNNKKIQTTKKTNSLRTKNKPYHSHKHKLILKNPYKLHNKLNEPHITTTIKNTHLLIPTKTIIYSRKPKIITTPQIKTSDGKTHYKNKTQYLKSHTTKHNQARPTGLARKKEKEKDKRKMKNNKTKTYQPLKTLHKPYNTSIKRHNKNNTNTQQKHRIINTKQPKHIEYLKTNKNIPFNNKIKTTKQINKPTHLQSQYRYQHSRKQKC